MNTVSKRTCLILSELLHDYGVRHVVVSPGTRCAPVVAALHRSGLFKLTTVVDERSAAFIALGIAARSENPVAMVCTSGSAMLDYAPALAEAYYRNIPLIAVTADRPAEWLDQLDGQTIRQHGALPTVFRRSVDIPVENGSIEQLFYINRLMNEALQTAISSPSGPVQINMQLSAPLVELRETLDEDIACKIAFMEPISKPSRKGLAEAIGSPSVTDKILIVVGGMHPDDAVVRSLNDISERHGAVVLSEVQANLGFPNPAYFEQTVDGLPVPDVVVAAGGAIVSARLKAWLRKLPKTTRFVSVGDYDNIVDTYLHNAIQARMEPGPFFAALEEVLEDYSLSADFKEVFMGHCRRPDPDDTSLMLDAVLAYATDYDIHFGNGMAIRYGQASTLRTSGIVDCNRGVNGIDGSTSTAIGSAMVSSRTTLLLTGDMSTAYDIGALATAGIPSTFKMAVLNNGGGDIFRRIPTTGPLPERELFFSFPPRLPLRKLAEAYGFAYFEADDSCDDSIRLFAEEKERPAILDIKLRPYDNGK